MTTELSGLKRWLGERLVERVDDFRRRAGHVQRDRCLGTVQMLGLFVGLSLHSRMRSLHELLRTVAEELELGIDVTVPAFCRARARFSPPAFALLS